MVEIVDIRIVESDELDLRGGEGGKEKLRGKERELKKNRIEEGLREGERIEREERRKGLGRKGDDELKMKRRKSCSEEEVKKLRDGEVEDND